MTGCCAASRGSRPAGALAAGVCARRCAASAFAGVGLRKGPRPAADLGAARGLGVWLGLVGDARFFFSAFGGHGSSWVRPLGEGAGRDSSFAWNGPRKGEPRASPMQRAPTMLHPRAREVERFCVHDGIPTRTQHPRPSRTRTQDPASTPAPTHSPRRRTSAVASRPVEAPFGDHPQREPRQRTSRTRASQAAQQQDEPPCCPPPTPYCPDSVGSRQVRSKGSRQARGAMSWWTALGPHVPTG